MESPRIEPWEDQRTPALAIVARGDQIRSLSPTTFVVRSQSRPDRRYAVWVRRDRWTCTCAFHRSSKRSCIHILAIRLREGIRDRERRSALEAECPKCRSGDVIRFGTRRSRSGPHPRFLCKTCGRRFTDREGFERRRGTPEQIALALDLYFRGVSFRKIADHFAQVQSLRVSRSTIYEWVVHYSVLAARWMDALQARTGERWHMDETVVSLNGKPRWVWNVLDADTRFLLATHVSRSRGVKDARLTLKRAKEATPDRPMQVYTDGLRVYPYAVGRELAYRSGSQVVNPHKRVRSIRASASNNLVERLHGTEKDRIRVMRGFDRRASAAAIMEGFRVNYNMVRPHLKLGTTPGVAAGMPDVGGFRWKGILQESTRGVPPGQVEIEFIVTPS